MTRRPIAEVQQERQDRLAEYLADKFVEFVTTKRRAVSQNEWAAWLRVSPVSLSQWINKVRLPDNENVDRIAARLGPEVYEIMDRPMRMPADPEFQAFAKKYFDSDEEGRRQAARVLDAAQARKAARHEADPVDA